MKFLNKLIILCTVFLISVTMSVNKVLAYNDFYSNNGILFYNSDSQAVFDVCLNNNTDINYSDISIQNQQIAAEFFSTTNFKGNNNQPLNIVQMAALMGNIQAESSFNPEAINSKNGYYGLIQWGSGRLSNLPEPKSDLLNQLNYIKNELDDNYYRKEVGDFWNISSINDLEKATFLITRNYEVAINTENTGPTYWTNSKDATEQLQHWERRINSARDILANHSGSNENVCKGLTEEQAIQYMNKYEDSDGNILLEKAGAHMCTGYPSGDPRNYLANCVAVVKYFIINNIDPSLNISALNTGDGKDVVNNLIKRGFIDGGTTPRAFSVFSTNRTSNPSVGHTGLVLGVDGDNLIIFEENCGEKLNKDGGDSTGIKKISKEQAITKGYTYAYAPNSWLVGF